MGGKEVGKMKSAEEYADEWQRNGFGWIARDALVKMAQQVIEDAQEDISNAYAEGADMMYSS